MTTEAEIARLKAQALAAQAEAAAARAAAAQAQLEAAQAELEATQTPLADEQTPSNNATFSEYANHVAREYTFSGTSFTLGTYLEDGHPLSDIRISLPIGMLNCHGLVAGATDRQNSHLAISCRRFIDRWSPRLCH